MKSRHEFHGVGWILSYAVLFFEAIKNTTESKICRKLLFFFIVLFIYLFFLTVTDIQSTMKPMSECVNQFLQCLYIYTEVFV